MPRYFFNVRSRSDLVSDHEGTELASLEEARLEAILDARAAMSRAILQGQDVSRRYVIEIVDASGTLLLSVPYTVAVAPDEP